MVFNKTKRYDIEAYINFIKSLIVDKCIKEEIIDKIVYFKKRGKIDFDGNNLYGKIITKNGTDYLEIRYENEHFIFNCIEWNNRHIINISQLGIKNNCIKIERREKTDYQSSNNNNEMKFEELAKIYDQDGSLIYQSTLEKGMDYSMVNKIMVYNVPSFANDFKHIQQWYFPDGTIIEYNLYRDPFEGHFKKESYSICRGIGVDNIYHFIKLDEELFKMIMTGKITTQEVFNEIDKNNKIKKI